MEAFITLLLDAGKRAETLMESLESNPSRIVLINSGILFEELLKSELKSHTRYSDNRLDATLRKLIQLAEENFKIEKMGEHWELLKNLVRMRNCAAHFKDDDMLFGDIVPKAIRSRFPSEVLRAPCLTLLQPEFVTVWKVIIMCIYVQVFYNIRITSALAQNGELAKDLKMIFDRILEWLKSSEAQEILQQLETFGEATETG